MTEIWYNTNLKLERLEEGLGGAPASGGRATA